MKRRIFLFSCLVVCFAVRAFAGDVPEKWDGTQGEWHGYAMWDFTHEDRPCKVVLPKTAAAGNPWVWRAVFWGHEPQTEIAMLEKGWAVAWVGASDLLGSPQNMKERTAFYDFLTETHEFNKKPVLLGMSRGGLCSLNWAIAHPVCVTALYLDAPVCDLRSWPGGKGTSPGSAGDWQSVLTLYGLDEATAVEAKISPVDTFAPLAEQKIPLLFVCGDADKVVPYTENAELFITRYEKAGGPVQKIVKPGVDHHPHSLQDPAPIVAFLLDAWDAAAESN